MEKKASAIRTYGKHLVRRSMRLLDSLFTDGFEQQQLNERHRSQLAEAKHKKALVVLQIKTKKTDHFETVVGHIASNREIEQQVVIRIQNNVQQLRIVPLNQIEKVSMLNTKTKKASL